jgi:hypothetical protein
MGGPAVGRPEPVIGLDTVIFGLPRDVAAALRAAEVGSQRWRDVLDLVMNIHFQKGRATTPVWLESAARRWADNGYPAQPERPARCVECAAPLDDMHCSGCDLRYGPSWLVDPERRIQLGLWEYRW